MIGFLRGTVAIAEEDNLMLDVNGVGYQIYAPLNMMAGKYGIGQEIMLYIHENIRDDAWLLFGFTTMEELNLFRQLISINGVGARLGLTIVNSLSLDVIVGSIISGNSEPFCGISGIGKKIAQRITLELKDKISKLGIDPGNISCEVENSKTLNDDEALMALTALGYSVNEVKAVINKLLVKDNLMTTDNIIRQGLRELSRL